MNATTQNKINAFHKNMDNARHVLRIAARVPKSSLLGTVSNLSDASEALFDVMPEADAYRFQERADELMEELMTIYRTRR